MKVGFPAGLMKVETMSDRGVKLIFNTAELGKDSIELFKLAHSEGWLVFSPNNDITEADIPKEKADPMLGNKTQAQRLRGVIYKIWEQKGGKGDFESYYKIVMERIIEKQKEHLD